MTTVGVAPLFDRILKKPDLDIVQAQPLREELGFPIPPIDLARFERAIQSVQATVGAENLYIGRP